MKSRARPSRVLILPMRRDELGRIWSSYKGLTVDTLAHRGDEGRGYLR